MHHSQDRQQLREQFFLTLAQAVLPLKEGPDPELTLEVLIEAANLLREHLESELAELRQEQAVRGRAFCRKRWATCRKRLSILPQAARQFQAARRDS